MREREREKKREEKFTCRSKLGKQDSPVAVLWCKLAFKNAKLSSRVQKEQAASRTESILRCYFPALYRPREKCRAKRNSITMLIYPMNCTHIFLVTRRRNESPLLRCLLPSRNMHRGVYTIRDARRYVRAKAVRIFVMPRNADAAADE